MKNYILVSNVARILSATCISTVAAIGQSHSNFVYDANLNQTALVYNGKQICAAPLPVRLINFDAVVENQLVLLKWTTSTEENVKDFKVEHSLNGKNWNNVGIIDAKGGSIKHLNYTFVHTTPSKGGNYYRLKITDQDETFAYSRIRMVQIEGNGNSIYPNPGSSVIYYAGDDLQDIVKATIYDNYGRTVLETTENLEEGISVSHLSEGKHVVKLLLKDGSGKAYNILISR
jgi:hypothetical protein